VYVYDNILAQSSSELKLFQTKVLELIKTQFMVNNVSENRAVYEIMGKNVDPGMLQMTTQYGAWALHVG
jgi:hypothetical protein